MLTSWRSQRAYKLGSYGYERIQGGYGGELVPALARVRSVQDLPVPEARVQGAGGFGIGAERVGEGGQTIENRLPPSTRVAAVDRRVREARSVRPAGTWRRRGVDEGGVLEIHGQPPDVPAVHPRVGRLPALAEVFALG